MAKLSHIEEGMPTMVDVGGKTATRRTATARAVIEFPPEVMAELRRTAPEHDLAGPKGPVFGTAVIAGIQAAKRTWELIPLCHPLPLDGIDIHCSIAGDTVEVVCTAKTFHTTGVEMEALTGASVAALTLYDMTKALSHAIVIRDVALISKTGGKSDYAAH
jgi:cyclic pyranopterin phosphate synthase